MALNQPALARADAAKVPSGFRYDITRSAARPDPNDTYRTNINSKSSSIDPQFWNVTWSEWRIPCEGHQADRARRSTA
jgi:hypothetical protein